MARASVSLITKKLSKKGSGDAYQSWKRVQQRGTINSTFLEICPLGLRPPVSASAIISSSSSLGNGVSVGLVISTISPFDS